MGLPIACIDIGASKTRAALFHSGKLSNEVSFNTPSTLRAALLAAKSSLGISKLLSVNVAVAGFVFGGKISSLPNKPKWRNIGVARLASEIFSCPALFENDVKCAALAEAKYGGAKGKNLAVLVYPGSGIGGALISDGKVIRGAKNACGEFGHMKIDFSANARKCGCGARGCFEAYSGGRGIEKAYFAKYGMKKSAKEIFTSKSNSDIAFAKNASYLFGLGLANISNALNPDAIILGGSLSNAYFGKYRRETLLSFKKNSILPSRGAKIILSRLPNPPLLGAALLVLSQ